MIRFTLIATIFTLLSCGGSKELSAVKEKDMSVNPDYAIHFIETDKLSRVLDKAAAEGKIVYLDISASWCLPCQIMKEEVYTHKATGDYMNENFVSYLVDADESNGQDLRAIFGSNSLPTLLFLDTRGRVLQKKEGAAFHSELKQMAESALAINKENQIQEQSQPGE